MEHGLGHVFGRSWACLGQLLGKLAACLGWSWAGRWVCGRQGLEIIEEKLEEERVKGGTMEEREEKDEQ